MRQAAAPQVLVGGGDHVFPRSRTESLHARRVLWAEQPRPREVPRSVQPEFAVRLGGQRKSPGAVAGLDRFVEWLDHLRSVGEDLGALRVVDAGGQLQLAGKVYV